MKIILASQSPRRKELLSLITTDFDVIVSDEKEELEEGLSIEEQAERLSFIKAKKVFDETKGNRIVIGSDTMVVKNGTVFGKPDDDQHAHDMLRALSGICHQVITGLAILVEKDGNYTKYITHDITDVYFNEMTDEEIDAWIKTGEANDKAGAYAIQGTFMVHIKKIDGNYSTVMGLPIHQVYDILKEII